MLFGFWFGLIHTLGSLVGTLAGVFLASRWYGGVAIWAQDNFSGSINVWNFIAFILLFIVINRLIGFLFHLAERAFEVVDKIPFLKSINRLSGAILGAVEGAVVIGAVLFIASRFPFDLEERVFAASQLKGYFINVFNILLPLVPEALQKADELLKK